MRKILLRIKHLHCHILNTEKKDDYSLQLSHGAGCTNAQLSEKRRENNDKRA